MCEYCENMTIKFDSVSSGKDFSETQGGEIQIENVNGFYYIAAVCFEGDCTESLAIKFCPMCGKNLSKS